MKTQILPRILLTAVALILLQACASTPSGPAGLAGTWTNTMGTVWTLRADGSFDVDLNKDGKRDAWGVCTFEGDTITVAGTGETIKNGCGKSKGVYHYKRTGNTLHFTLVSDSCQKRKEHLAVEWTKK